MSSHEPAPTAEARPPSPATLDSEKINGERLESDATRQEGQIEDATEVKPKREKKFKELSWPQLTICLIVEAIALGATSIAGAFAKVGLLAGIILCVGLGFIAIYTSVVVGQVALKFPSIIHYPQAVRHLCGRWGERITGVMLVLLMTLLTGGHALTGTVAFYRITGGYEVCAIGLSVASAIILFLLSLPPTFHDFSWLGYIDFFSIMSAIVATIVGTAIAANGSPAGFEGVDWTWMPPSDVSFVSAFEACTSIVFAYSYIVCQFSFMREMKKPTDFRKSIWCLGLTEIVLYTVSGLLIYVFTGADVKSPSLLSAGTLVSRIAFGLALPVIFISGSINTTVCARYLLDSFAHKDKHEDIKYVEGKRGWLVWSGIMAAITFVAWIIAEAIPYFSPLLGIISALFLSGFNFYFPAWMYFKLLMKGKWYARENIFWSILNGIIFAMGVVILVVGTYTSMQNIIDQANAGDGRGAFACDSAGYL